MKICSANFRKLLALGVLGCAAGAAMGASEGGDTWSSVAPASPRGSAMNASAATRVVRVDRAMSDLNVAWGERIEFRARDEHGVEHAFAWRFDLSPALTHVDLAQIAPPDFPQSRLRVFVSPQPEYRGG